MKYFSRSLVLTLLIVFLIGKLTQAATVLFPIGGGTGTSTTPTTGQILVGNSGGTYSLTSTSSLGLGTVKSVNTTVPTGLTGTGCLITTSGTCSISLTSGYVIPLTASTSQWSGLVNNPVWKVGNGVIYTATSTDNVGIGDTNPTDNKLVVQKTLGSSDPVVVQGNLQVQIKNGTPGQYLGIGQLDDGTGMIQGGHTGVGWLPIMINPVSANVYLTSSNINNKVGVGVFSPNTGAKLDVGGSVKVASNRGFYNEDVLLSGANTYYDGNWKGVSNGPASVFRVGQDVPLIIGYNSSVTTNGIYTPNYLFSVENNGRVGIGVGTGSASAKLHIISTTEQMRSAYDVSNYWSATTDSTGSTIFDAVGSGSKFTFNDPVSLGSSLFANGSEGTSGYVLQSRGTATSPQWVATSTLGISGGGSGNSAFTIGNGFIYNATSTDRVGIGSTTPSATLGVQGNGTTIPFTVASSTNKVLFTVIPNGFTGIGTTTPVNNLHVYDTVQTVLARFESSSGSGSGIYLDNSKRSSGKLYSFLIGNIAAGTFSIKDESAALTRLVIDSSGKTGINNTNPGGFLTVQGTASAPTADIFQFASSSGTVFMSMDARGRVSRAGALPTLGTCGTSPTITSTSTDDRGIITTGTVTGTCTLNFSANRTAPPICFASASSTSITANVIAATVSTVTFGFAGGTFNSGTFNYFCTQ